MPEEQCNLLHDSEWANGDPPAAQAESYLLQEVVPFIDAHERMLADPAHRAIGGLSMRDYAAVNITFQHPDVFNIAFSHSGNYRAQDHLGANACPILYVLHGAPRDLR